MRFRETLAGEGYKLAVNRTRLHDEDQLAVKFKELPNPDAFVDDFMFGYLVAANDSRRKEYRATIKKERSAKAAESFAFKRDSVLRMNMAKGLEPYRHNAVFTQSPKSDAEKGSAYQNATTSALLHRETAVTAFQYPFALSLADCQPKPDWTRKLLQAIGELNGVAGNHARSYFEMAPASVIVRLTPQLVAGYQTYCFRADGKLPHVVEDILAGDRGYSAGEFFIGGELVKRELLKRRSGETQEGRRHAGS